MEDCWAQRRGKIIPPKFSTFRWAHSCGLTNTGAQTVGVAPYVLRCRLGPRHRTRASGQCAKCVECFGTAKLRQCWPMPADPPASTNGPTATATERGRARARRPAPPESRIGYLGGVSWEVLVTPLAGRSEISAHVGLMTAPLSNASDPFACPFGSLRKGRVACSIVCAGCRRPALSTLAVPCAVPHSGHCTRL